MEKVKNTKEILEELEEKHKHQVFLMNVIFFAVTLILCSIALRIGQGLGTTIVQPIQKTVTEDTYSYLFTYQDREKTMQSLVVQTHYKIEDIDQIAEIEKKYGFKTAYYSLIRTDRPEGTTQISKQKQGTTQISKQKQGKKQNDN